MPSSDNQSTQEVAVEGQNLAVLAESLYVANLLILPGLAFVVLVSVYLSKIKKAPALARSHLQQTVSGSLNLGLAFVFITVLIFVLHQLSVAETTLWIIGVLLFTCAHALMVIFGVIGLAKAMAGKSWPYPLLLGALLSRRKNA